MKKLFVVTFGLSIATALLYLMTRLVATPLLETPEQESERPRAEFQVRPETEPETNQPTIVPPSVVPAVVGEPSPVQLSDNSVSDIEPITINTDGFVTVDTSLEQGLYTGINGLGANGFGGQDRQAIALFQSTPRYPIVAQTEGIEGWVKLRYDVSPSGLAVNIKVVEAKPRRVFDSEAKKALKRWKFKAEQVDGKAVTLKNQSVVMEFKLEQDLVSN